MSMPLAMTAMVPPLLADRAPRWAAVSMPRARPDTTVQPACASSRAQPSAMRMAAAEALRAPTIATGRRVPSATSPRAMRMGGAPSAVASSGG